MNQGWPKNWGSQKPPCGVPLDLSHPLSCGLVSYCPMNEGGGKITRDVVSGQIGQLAGGASWGPDGFGTAINLPENEAYISFPKSSRSLYGDVGWSFTIQAKTTGGATANAFGYCGYRTAGYPYKWWQFEYYVGYYYFEYTNGTVSTYVRWLAGSPLGTYATYTVSRAVGGSYSLYVNGRLIGTVVNTETPYTSEQQMVLGKVGLDVTNSWNYFGNVRNFSVYARSLTAAEAWMLHTQPYCMFESGEPFLGDLPAAAVYETQKRRLLGVT